MIARILGRLAVAFVVLVCALLLILRAVAASDPGLQGVFGWLILFGLPTLLLALVWVFAPRRRP